MGERKRLRNEHELKEGEKIKIYLLYYLEDTDI
jgi:hypothetical protein